MNGLTTAQQWSLISSLSELQNPLTQKNSVEAIERAVQIARMNSDNSALVKVVQYAVENSRKANLSIQTFLSYVDVLVASENFNEARTFIAEFKIRSAGNINRVLAADFGLFVLEDAEANRTNALDRLNLIIARIQEQGLQVSDPEIDDVLRRAFIWRGKYKRQQFEVVELIGKGIDLEDRIREKTALFREALADFREVGASQSLYRFQARYLAGSLNRSFAEALRLIAVGENRLRILATVRTLESASDRNFSRNVNDIEANKAEQLSGELGPGALVVFI